MDQLTIFFDESGKNQDKPHLMGALSIPSVIYDSLFFEQLQRIISTNEIHWKSYKGDSRTRENIKKIMETLLEHHDFTKINVIHYNQSIIREKARNFRDVDQNLGDATIYMKLPERIVYGLLRNYGDLSKIEARIVIEEADEYKQPHVNLKEQLPRLLNIQATYRGENFKVTKSEYANKGKEIGLEITDLLLGMVRTIITSPPYETRKQKAQINLIIQLLKNKKFFTMLQQITFYEWSSSQELKNVPFDHYLQLFISKNYSLYIH